MTNQETTDGFAQLSLLGMKAGTIVRRTGVKKTTVDKHLAVARAEGVRLWGSRTRSGSLTSGDRQSSMVGHDRQCLRQKGPADPLTTCSAREDPAARS